MIVDPNIDVNNDNEKFLEIMQKNAEDTVDKQRIVKDHINNWLRSEEREWMIIGEKYYRNETDILDRVRKVVGESGALEEVTNLANNKLVNGFVRKLNDQKVGYLLSKGFSIKTENEDYLKLLNPYFDKRFMHLIKSTGTESVNKGIAWLHVYYNNQGQLSFMKIPSQQCKPIWLDDDHTQLGAMIRHYAIEVYDGQDKKVVKKVEWWDTDGVQRYVFDGDRLIPDIEAGDLTSHVILRNDKGEEIGSLNWERVPFIPFKYNDEEIPLVKLIKSLVDDYDKQKSDVANNLEDLPNSIYVVTNYGDTKPETFRKNIAQYRVVFTDKDGGVDSVSLETDTETYVKHQQQNRKDIYEFGRGVDTQTDKFGNDPSGVALKFLYADLDLDCDFIESHFQMALEELLWFIDTDLANKDKGEYFDEVVEFIFNRDMIISETDKITNIKNSQGITSNQTNLSQHPWVSDVQKEEEQIEKEKRNQEESFNRYRFPNNNNQQSEEDDEGNTGDE